MDKTSRIGTLFHLVAPNWTEEMAWDKCINGVRTRENECGGTGATRGGRENRGWVLVGWGVDIQSDIDWSEAGWDGHVIGINTGKGITTIGALVRRRGKVTGELWTIA